MSEPEETMDVPGYDHSAVSPELVVLTGHTAPVRAAAFSPDGRLLATTADDGSIILWDAESGAVHRVWQGNVSSPAVGFTADGEQLVTGEQGIVFRNVRSGAWEGTIPTASNRMIVRTAGDTVISADSERFNVMECRSGSVIRRIPHGPYLGLVPLPAAISADGSTGAVGGSLESPRELRIWDLRSGKLRRVRRLRRTLWWKETDPSTGKSRRTHGAQADVGCLALSPDGRQLAVGGSFTLWLCNTGPRGRSQLLLCGCNGAQSVTYSADGSLLAAGTSSGSVLMWRLTAGEVLHVGDGHTSWVSALAFSPDGRFLASADHDRAINIWPLDGEVRTPRRLCTETAEARAVAYSPDGTAIAVGYSDGLIRLWNARTGVLTRLLATDPGHAGPLSFSADGAVLYAGQTCRGAWSISSGERLPLPEQEGIPAATGVQAQYGGLVARSEGWDGVIELCERDTGKVIRSFSDPEDADGIAAVAALTFSPDGTVLAAGYAGFRVRLWDVATGERRQLLRSHGDFNTSLAFSPDGSLLAVGGDYGTEVVLCNLREQTHPVRMVLTLAEQQDPEGTAQFFDLTPEELPGREVSLEGHTNNIRGVCFSPDGEKAATVAADAALKLWETATGRLLATFLPVPGGDPTRSWITLTPDSYYVCLPETTPSLRWRVGDDLLEAAAFAETYASPETVAARLA